MGGKLFWAGVGALGALGFLYFGKPRFLGDKAKQGDLVTVPIAAIPSAAAAAVPGGSGSVVVQVQYIARDTVSGPAVGYVPPGAAGFVPLGAPTPQSFTVPRSAIVGISTPAQQAAV